MGECETLLRKHYNISNNEALYIQKIDIFQEGMKVSKIEYNVYCKSSEGGNLIKLNLTICSNNKISIFIPIKFTENIDKLNSSSGYYNDVCYTTSSEDGTDISLKDRQTEFIEKNKTICQDDCQFSEYDYDTLKAKCSCNVKEVPSTIADMNINKAKLLENFYDIKSFSNFNFLVCYKNLFKIEGILENIGSYLMLTIILFHLITIITFYIKQFPLIKKEIKNIILNIYKYQPNKKKEKLKKDEIINKFIGNEIYIYKNVKKRDKKNRYINNLQSNNDCLKNKANSKIIRKCNQLKGNNKMKFIDEELNALPYYSAIQYDRRTYCNYYSSLLRTKHNLIFAFCNNMDYNARIIKIDLFFIGFTIDFAVNIFFMMMTPCIIFIKVKGNLI